MGRWRVGVDSGGTFTDVCLFEETAGAVLVWKVSSTPDDPSRAIAQGVEEGTAQARAGDAAFEVSYFGHGTTVATNALIQKRGVRTALITTEGFRDLLEIARQKRPSLYDLQVEKPEALVPRDLRFEVRERVHYDGRIELPLAEDEVRELLERLPRGIEAIAVAFLYSFIRPEHEQLVRRLLEAARPELFVTCSHEVSPEFREYERISTTVVNAYVGPVMSRYLSRLEPRLRNLGIDGSLHVTQSNGGIISFETAAEQPVRTVLSGPSTGVVAALEVGRLAGFDNLITFDMGGTSTDVSLIEAGRPRLAAEMEVQGYPIKTPMIDINTVGAGGGSIAYIDAGGLLKVGPRSAGADPGPVCYGRGNDEPTVTDANVVLQSLNPKYLLAGRMAIDQAPAKAAIVRLAERLRLDAMTTAQGILSVVIANMAKAIRVISVQRGHDPRDYTLVAFGGAGPLHAARLARELEVPRVLVPRNPGILCALGLLLTDMRTDYAQTAMAPLGAGSLDHMEGVFRSLEARAAEWFEREAIPPERRSIGRAVDMRYAGQNYELTVGVPSAENGEALLEQLKLGFEAAHEQLYGYLAPEEPIQLVTFRLEAQGLVRKAALRRHEPPHTEVTEALIGTREMYLPERDGFVACPVLDRERLGPGHELEGPAIVEQMDSTTVILPGQRARVDPYLNLLIRVERP